MYVVLDIGLVMGGKDTVVRRLVVDRGSYYPGCVQDEHVPNWTWTCSGVSVNTSGVTRLEIRRGTEILTYKGLVGVRHFRS